MSKYRAKRTMVDGIMFDSMKEAARYRELRLLEKAGEIAGLCLQPEYELTVGGVKIGTYRADFEYVEGDAHIVEDVKGFKTPLYRWKAKHFKAEYGIQIRET